MQLSSAKVRINNEAPWTRREHINHLNSQGFGRAGVQKFL